MSQLDECRDTRSRLDERDAKKGLEKKKDKKIGPEVVGEIEERVRNSEVTKAFWC